MTLFLYVARRALAAFAGALVAVVALFLVVDFAENANIFHGPGWVTGALAYYANKATVVAYQIAPAAMLLAAAVTASGFRKTREYTAMRALGLGPWRLATPVLAVMAVVGGAMAFFGDTLVVDASMRSEQIMAERFNRSGTWQRWHEMKSWFRGRGGRRIYHLRQAGPAGSFEGVTVFEITPEFKLSRRIDADRMIPDPSGNWILEGVQERTFGVQGQTGFEAASRKTYRFDEDPEAFAIRPGRPAEMRRAVVGEQIALRRRLGLPVADFRLEWHNKLAYPLAGVPAGLLALALALRRNRRGHLTAALVEAVGISLLFWAVQGIAWSMALAGRLGPAVGAWGPDAAFLVVGFFSVRKNS
jgi:lipopolysaccharide export system permease protein